jgi:hypothetical protein
MKYVGLLLGIALFSLATGLKSQQSSSQQRPTLGPEPAPNHPTLGDGAPSLMGPMNAKILDPARLRMVHKIYIELMDNSLNLKLIQDFSVGGPFKVVSDRRAADAVLQGTCFNSPHLKDVHSELYLTGQNGKPIWQDIIHQSYNPPALRTAVADSATKAVADLRASVEAAERR